MLCVTERKKGIKHNKRENERPPSQGSHCTLPQHSVPYRAVPHRSISNGSCSTPRHTPRHAKAKQKKNVGGSVEKVPMLRWVIACSSQSLDEAKTIFRFSWKGSMTTSISTSIHMIDWGTGGRCGPAAGPGRSGFSSLLIRGCDWTRRRERASESEYWVLGR